MAARVPHPYDVVVDLVAGALWEAYRAHPLNSGLAATEGWLNTKKKATKGDAEAIRVTTLARAEAEAALTHIDRLGLIVAPAKADGGMTAIAMSMSRKHPEDASPLLRAREHWAAGLVWETMAAKGAIRPRGRREGEG